MPRPRYRKSVRLWKRPAISSIAAPFQRLLEQQRQLQQRVDVRPRRRRGQHAAHLAQAQGEEIERDQLRGERLGRRDADLRTRVGIDRPVGLARRHAADHVADGDAGGAFALRLAQRGQRVGRLARLRDDDGERVWRHNRLAVAVLGSVVHFDRDARQLLDHELADEAGVPRGAARQNRDVLDRGQLGIVELHLFEKHLAGVLRDAAEDRLAGGSRLLEDFLEHEVLVAGLLRHDRIPQHALGRLGDRPSAKIGEHGAGPGDDRHLLVVQEDDVARVAEDRRDVRGDEELAVAEADDDRRTVSDGDDLARIVRRDEHEREEPAQELQRPPDAVLQPVVPHLALDEVRDDLGVRLGDERVALLLQFLLQIEIVLDDPVVDDDDLAGAVAVRVRVLFRRTAVGRPARVPDAVVARNRIGFDDLFEVRQLAGAPPQIHRAVVHDGDARRVVPAVLEPPQPVDEHGHDVLRSDIADNSAHSLVPRSYFLSSRRLRLASAQPPMLR